MSGCSEDCCGDLLGERKHFFGPARRCVLCNAGSDDFRPVVRSLALLFIMDFSVYTRALDAACTIFPRVRLRTAVNKYLKDLGQRSGVQARRMLIATGIDTLALSLTCLPGLIARAKLDSLRMAAVQGLKQSRDVTSIIATYLLSGEVGTGHLTHVKKNAYILSRHPALSRASGNELEWVQGRTYKNLVQAHHVMLKSLQTGLHRAQGLAELCNAQPYKRLCQQLITLITRTLAEPRLLVSVICHKHFEPIVSP